MLNVKDENDCKKDIVTKQHDRARNYYLLDLILDICFSLPTNLYMVH